MRWFSSGAGEFLLLSGLVLWMSVWAHGFEHFWSASARFICYTCANLWPSLDSGGLFRLGPKYFAHTLEVFARFFCFVLFFGSWCERMFLAHFVQHLLQPWNHPFLQAALVSFSVKWYSKTIVWMLEVLIALGFCLLAFSLDKVRIYFLR